jgi:excisionase family DNA binding protein
MCLIDEKLDQIYDILQIILQNFDPKTPGTKPSMRMKEAAEYLGISKATLYTYTSQNRIPYHKVQNRQVYFSVEDLNNFILSKDNRVRSNEEVEGEAAKRMTEKLL